MSTAVLQDPRSKALAALKKVNALATLPEVTAKIIRTVEDPNSNAAQLHRIIANDPSLVTRVLKLVNSSFYGLPGKVTSIERAIVLLGLNAVKNVAVAASIGQLFRGIKMCDGFVPKDLWTHCIAVAVAAREMARRSKVAVPEEAFLGGMVHDIGLVVSLQLWPEKVRWVCDQVTQHGQRWTTAEREQIGVDHGELGAALAEQWRFPASCQSVMNFHHTPSQVNSADRPLVILTYLADIIACQAKIGFTLTAQNSEINLELASEVHISQELINQISGDLHAMVESASSTLW